VKITQIMFFFLSLISSSVLAQNSFNHQTFDSVLQNYVDKQGRVNYQAIKQERLLGRYLDQLKNVESREFETWSEKEKMAFWINAYNAVTLAGIIKNYPIEYGNLIARARFPKNSIRQIGGFWDTVFIQIMNQDISLNEIEHEILRKKYQDPRIHAVLVCAAIGCPILENRAFYPEDLDDRLDEANRHFINNPDKVKLDKDKNILYLSSIMDWYKQDYLLSSSENKFYEHYPEDIRGVIEFVLGYVEDEKKEFILANHPKVKFLDYDWTLNEQ